MDLIYAGWHPSTFDSGRTLQVPANYGTEGSLSWNDWTPTYVPPVSPAPSIKQWNRVVPIDWNQYVLAPYEVALVQASLQQQSRQTPAEFVPPSTASLRLPDTKG